MSDASSRNDARHNSPGLKLITVVVLTLLMIAPLFIINLALSGREERATEAAGDVASGWGATQTVAGPALFVPYDIERQSVVDGKTFISHERQHAVLLPKALSIAANVDTATRWRGIFRIPVYSTALTMGADFGAADLTGAFPDGAQIHWNEAYAGLVISDPRGLANNVSLRINDHSAMFQPGI